VELSIERARKSDIITGDNYREAVEKENALNKSTRYIPTTESNQEDVMQSYRTRQRLANNQIDLLKSALEKVAALRLTFNIVEDARVIAREALALLKQEQVKTH
jgi:hypothetical protein